MTHIIAGHVAVAVVHEVHLAAGSAIDDTTDQVGEQAAELGAHDAPADAASARMILRFLNT
ncbi:hypothetical protein [Streptomyces sp. NPDC047024]|uniref:hypothetical protein n=1 Tax=Streptomyces sp. NPDC047024 TaxID=3155476 RepID=UPI00340016A6